MEPADVGPSIEESSEFQLPPDEFRTVCSLAEAGNVRGLARYVDEVIRTCDGHVGPHTFCPDPCLQQPSPFVVAAQHGHKEVVEYFLEKFGDDMDINHSATIVSLTTKKKVHCATALWAASTGGHLLIVQLLVKHRAEVNKPTLTQSTPLRGASFHGHLKVMDFLLSNGAEINTPNCIGQSPLCIAAMRGQLEAVVYLVEKGANVNQTTINGYSVMHLAATKGRTEVVKFLFTVGVSPMFSDADSARENYIPCPLFLAASTGQRKMVEELIAHPDCPPSCKADALLLLGATRCEVSQRGLTMSSKDMWLRGLDIREANELETNFLPPIESYGNRVEMQDLEQLHKLSNEPNFTRYEAYFQSLIIRERCMGYGDQGLIYFLIRRGTFFCLQGYYRETEQLWFRAMDMEMKACEVELGHARYGHSDGLQRDLEKDVSQYACGIYKMVQDDYKPDFRRFIEFGMQALEVLDRLKAGSASATFIDLKVILGVVLYILRSWLHYDKHVSTTEREEGAFCSQECNEVATTFVKKYLHAISGSTLLHYALTNFTILEDEETIYDKYDDICPLIEGLLHWGCDEVIDLPDAEGRRPIHIAVEQANELEDTDVTELVTPLVNGGAHLDAVCRTGQTALYMCTSEVVKVVILSSGPAFLSCQAANRIVSERIPYQTIGLPPHVIALVKLHDRCVLNS